MKQMKKYENRRKINRATRKENQIKQTDGLKQSIPTNIAFTKVLTSHCTFVE
jgi:hypothetical protein